MRKNFVLLMIAALLLPTFVLSGRAQQQRRKSDSVPAQKAENAKSSQTEMEDQEDEGQKGEEDPDLPDFAGARTSKRDFLLARDEHINLLRGFPYKTVDSRVRAIYAMKRQEIALAQNRGQAIAERSWKAIGPAPIPNGQTSGFTAAVSGRTSRRAAPPARFPRPCFGRAAPGWRSTHS